MNSRLFASCLLVLSAACSSASSSSSTNATFPATPLAAVDGDSSAVHVELRSAPTQPLETGLDSIELVVTDKTTGEPLDGLTLTMTPWMPAMGHGTSTVPTLEAKGNGHYVFSDVSLFMPGEWQLRVAITGSVSDKIAPTFSLP